MNERLDVIFNGLALIDCGLISDYNTISGIGLNTFGELWSAQDIWADNDPMISTSWTNNDPAVTTIWTEEFPQ